MMYKIGKGVKEYESGNFKIIDLSVIKLYLTGTSGKSFVAFVLREGG